MINKKVLIIGTYPIAKPIHGGQKRAKAIFEFYKNLFINTKYIGVFHRGQYPDWGEDDILLGQPDIIQKIDEFPPASELIAGEAIDNDIHVRSNMAKFLIGYRPDVIHIEQPFPYIGLKILLKELRLTPKLIFGSQNIEFVLKGGIFKGQKTLPRIRESLVKQTRDLEYNLSKKADLVISVNVEDADEHIKMGAKKCIVIPNGISRVYAPKNEINYWYDFKKQNNIKHVITFIGSGHPPNWEGFLKMVGDDTTFLPQDSKIFIAGGVSNYFKNEYKDKSKCYRFWSGVEVVGELEEPRLAALLRISDVIILPIITKRGSNLKTAEAILSGKKIVATQFSFKGFEKYLSLPNIFFANSTNKFKENIVNAIDEQYVKKTPEQDNLAKSVQWRHCLQPLAPEIENIFKHSYKKRFFKICHWLLNIFQTINRVKLMI